jgi:hypothetical protein
MKSKSEAPLALQELIQDIGIPEHIHTDGAKEIGRKPVMNMVLKCLILRKLPRGRTEQKLKSGK